MSLSSRRPFFALLLALTACESECGMPRLNDDVPTATLPVPPHLHHAIIPTYLRSSIFPPQWSVGQTWLLSVRQRSRYWGESPSSLRFVYVVRSADIAPAASESQEASVDSNVADMPLGPPRLWDTRRLRFSLHPFWPLESWSVDGWGRPTHRWFVGDGGPCCASCGCDGFDVPSEKFLDANVGKLEAQASEPMENGIRFYFGADKEHPRVIEWLSGDPWWSRAYVLDQPEPQMPGLGTDWARLVRLPDGTPMSPPPLPQPDEPEPDAGPVDALR